MASIVAVVPARAGSERVKDKNFRPFAGSSLLEIKIRQMVALRNAGWIDEVVVNSDSKQAKELADQAGAPFQERNSKYARSDCLNCDYWWYLAASVGCDHLIVAQPTAPLITHKTYTHAIRDYLASAHFDSLMSVEPVREFLWQNGEPINYDRCKAPKSQDLPPIVRLTFGVCIANRRMVLEQRSLVGKHPWLFPLDRIEGMDIDDEYDFRFAEMLYLERLEKQRVEELEQNA